MNKRGHAGGNMNRRVLKARFKENPLQFCFYCNCQVFLGQKVNNDNAATGDHRTPLCRGGRNTRENIVICCVRCNGEKAVLTVEEYLTLRHSPKALKQRIYEVCVETGLIPPDIEERREARRLSIEARVQPPDPDCRHCLGTGWQFNKPAAHCRCAIRDCGPDRWNRAS